MTNKYSVIDVFQHTRHDWLNRIQLIKGYMGLQKFDQAERVINEIIEESRHETRLTNLHIPEFATILFVHNWGAHSFQIEYHILNDLRTKNLNDHLLKTWILQFFEKLEEASDSFNENHLSITIEPQEETIFFLFHFNGVFHNTTGIQNWLQSQKDYMKEMHIKELNKYTLITTWLF